MNEASKTKKLLTKDELGLFFGKGIDIGCGSDPITDECQRFDIEDGDANCITDFIDEEGSYDYVVSIHSLEHMYDPEKTLQDWWKLVKPNGMMMIVVPDEDLYEQGYWPSLFNWDHKATFTLSKQKSYSSVSYNLYDLANILKDAKIISLRLQDNLYKRKRYVHKIWPRAIASFFSRVRYKLYVDFRPVIPLIDVIYSFLRLPIDQTLGDATAQNILIIKKMA
ncbi:MAG TPA: methyltransferase domain-containing protein [Sulfurimonas autotrophica]|nr:methyltransferase domain-containing protein [Sulfurimonas autotrophica]